MQRVLPRYVTATLCTNRRRTLDATSTHWETIARTPDSVRSDNNLRSSEFLEEGQKRSNDRQGRVETQTHE